MGYEEIIIHATCTPVLKIVDINVEVLDNDNMRR